MKRIAIALLCLSPALATADEYAVEREAAASGLKPRELRMLAGAPSTYAEYRTSYRLARDKLRRAAYEDYDVPPPRRRARADAYDRRLESEAPPRDEAETYAFPIDD
ncbi:MAG TPA: hypothetical protein VND91_09815 [Candidatus Saccharimonadia bacterium]|nr:hypothetical protein [Candidatus Saccharimonadia bacterium]